MREKNAPKKDRFSKEKKKKKKRWAMTMMTSRMAVSRQKESPF